MTAYLRITGYSDQISALPGGTINFMVSCDGVDTYRADIVRVIHGDMNPAGPDLKEELIRTSVSRNYDGRKQQIHPGSSVIVPAHPALDELASFTVQCMIWPTTPGKGEQCLVSRWDTRSKGGFQLLIDADGAVALRVGDGKGKVETVSAGRAMLAREWYFVGASFDAKTKRIRVYQEPQRRYAKIDTGGRGQATAKLGGAGVGAGPLTMAAYHQRTSKGRTLTAGHYNGKIDSPRLARRALDRSEMEQLMRGTVPTHLQEVLVGRWDFSREIKGIRIVDLTANALHGETHNLPARAMTGFNWTGENAKWETAPEQYGAIHFHDDDLYDCGWEVDFSLTVPSTMKSGCYAARLRGGEHEEYIPFYVRAPLGKPTAKILYLAPTASYLSYANLSVAMRGEKVEMMSGRLVQLAAWEQHLNENPELGASQYDEHSDHSGICYSSRLRPILNMRPKVITALAGVGSGVWQYNADTHLTDWMEAQGFDFDVATDEDLDREGIEVLKSYSVVITGSHPEYTSTRMWDAFYAYTQQGGRLMYMGGNGFYWWVAYSDALPGVMEVRRSAGGTRAWAADPGEFHHSFDGQHGGLWRFQDRSPQRLVGAGFVSQGFDICTYFRQTAARDDPRVKWAFEGVGKDELLGDFGLVGGGAAGLEVDWVDRKLGTPPHALVVAQSEDLTDLYLLVAEEVLISTPDSMGSANADIRGDIVFYETPNGGAVFSFSSISYCGSLSHNDYKNNISRLTANVLKRFATDKSF